ncbi:uncharacterized protein LOC127102503 [Lathyrus oleraceus]|uniref:uncharacterized protein LOC127102503 n=1 Tax=Pisum sativum TaxID=3888 RepID=UPI0021CE2E3F|nr:uncharacterized protein LOC127102503 [Pisum sativum]
MQLLDVPEWKWDNISMDFVTSLPNTAKGNDDIWVIMDRPTKSTHFIPIKINFLLQKLAEIYISIIVKLHGIPYSIVSDRDPRKCRTPICWYETGENVMIGPEIVQQTTEKVKMKQEKMKASQSRHKSYHDKRRKAIDFCEDDHIFLRVTPMIGVGRALKSNRLTPCFIGPYQITQRVGAISYKIALPQSLMDDVHVRDNMTIKALSLMIANREVKQLRGKEISLVKAVWGGPAGGSMTWESKVD